MEQKFKVGQKVKADRGEGKIVYYTEESGKESPYLVDFGAPVMGGHEGNSVSHGLKLGSRQCRWYSEKELTLIDFGWKDLKAGMVIELKDGTVNLLVENLDGNLFGLDKKHSYLPIEYIQSDLTCKDAPNLDIMKVYSRAKAYPQLLDISTYGRFLLWERTTKEMTVEEISKALGYDVKVVK